MRRIVLQVNDAVNYCHGFGVLHRDIKLDNLLIANDQMGIDSVKLADFGLAKQLDNSLKDRLANTNCGTPAYVAPEVLSLEPYGKACDYWSIGVVTFILMCGEAPFYSNDETELFEKIVACDYNFDDDGWKNISYNGMDFVRKLLVTDPKKRMGYDQVLNHPWLTDDLENKPSLEYIKKLPPQKKAGPFSSATLTVSIPLEL